MINKEKYIAFLDGAEEVPKNELSRLEEIIDNFPYCHSAHALIARIHRQTESILSESKARRAAAYSPNRKVLKYYLLKKNVAQPVASIEENNKKAEPESIKEPVKPASDAPLQKEPTSEKEEKQEEKPAYRSEIEENLKQLRNIRQNLKHGFDQEEESAKKQKEKENKQQEPNKVPAEEQQEEKNTQPEKPLTEEKASEPEKPQAKEEKPTDPKQDVKKKAEKIEVKPKPVKKAKPEAKASPANNTKEEDNKAKPRKSAKKARPKPQINSDQINEQDRLSHQLASSRLGESAVDPEEKNQSDSDTDLMLQYLRSLNHLHQQVEPKKVNKRPSKKDQVNIIDDFIKKDPTISSPKDRKNLDKPNEEDLSKNSAKWKKLPVSENMAKIYLKQGNKIRAKEIYEQLLLKYPEKKSYFANQLEKIRKED